MTQSGEKVIYFSKVTAILLIVGAVVFTTLGLKLFERSLSELTNPQQYFALAIALACLTSAIGCGFVGFKMLLTSIPGLIINDDGLIVNSNGVNFGFIPWCEITAIQKTSLRMSKIILIDVKNPQYYAQKCTILIRLLNWLNPSPQSTPIKISAHALNITHQDLLPLLQDYHLKNQP
ncbi:STM3941 family protein [Kiloniella antarctica]|uniref:STM3941 family protein n=1 Tax=Kiloniella antarctica TaxID=1550907 RepID=A0ABW5BHF3_9PROT